MTSDKFRSGMDHNVRFIFYGPHQVRCSKGRIYDQGNVMPVSDPGQLFQIRHIRMGISQSLCKNRFCIFPYFLFKSLFILRICKAGCNTAGQRKGMGQKIISSSIDPFGGYDMFPCFCQGLKSIGNGCRSRSSSQSPRSSLQSRHSLFKYFLCGIGQPSVNISRLLESKPFCSLATAVKHIRSGGVNRNCPGPCCRIRLFLSRMHLFCLEAPVFRISYICHNTYLPFSFDGIYPIMAAKSCLIHKKDTRL